jgi:transcriptional regulator with XRE-family HTH domain
MDPRETLQARKLRASFAEELRRWRTVRRWTMRDLAERMLFDPSYISHVEGLRHRPTEDFARRADDALGAAGALLSIWVEYDAARGAARSERAATSGPEPSGQAALVVEREEAVQFFDGEIYTIRIRRDLHNQTAQPIIRYFVRVSVDEGPGGPLTLDDLGLYATCEGRPMALDVETDQDSLKEVWLLFRNPGCRYPLQPGGRTIIEYGYRVPKDVWGDWFQRSIRVPTRKLVVRLVFPLAFSPSEVWGLETSPPVADGPLDIEDMVTSTERVFEWGTTDPWMDARYRLEWQFPPGSPHAADPRAVLGPRDTAVLGPRDTAVLGPRDTPSDPPHEPGQYVDVHVDEALHR